MPQRPNGQPPNRRLPAVICFLLAVFVWAVFGQTRHHEFINYDDNHYVYENPAIIRGLDWNGIAWVFTHIHGNNWHPLTTISHMLDCELYGLKVGGHHLTNVLFHMATVALPFLWGDKPHLHPVQKRLLVVGQNGPGFGFHRPGS